MESVSRISSVLGNTHGLNLDAAAQLGALRRPTTKSVPARTAAIKKLLDSKHEKEVVDGLRQVITLSHRPPIPDSPLLFSSVLKNIASPSSHAKKLVYIHLLQHAEADPDTALLSINTIQKTLSHPDPALRALALRVMASMRVPVIAQIVLLAIKKGAADMSPLVRRAAALAVPKCARLDPGALPQLEETLGLLLGDRQYFVAGAAVAAFMEAFGWARVDMVHRHYRGLVRKMVDMDEWGQVATLRLMAGYARRCFPQRWTKGKTTRTGSGQSDFYGEELDSAAAEELVPLLDPDLELLLKAALPLLQSRNSAVVVAVARLYLNLAPPPPHSPYLAATAGPLVALLRAAPDICHTALYYIVQVALAYPAPFVRHATHFLLRSTDTPEAWRLKLELLTIIFPHAPAHTQSLVLGELAHFAASTNPALVRDCVRAVGRCAQASPPGSAVSARCMRLLMGQLASASDSLVAESLTVVRHLIQADPAAHVETVTRLAKNLDTMTNAQARASIIWLVGEYAGAGDGDNIAADVLRILVKGFADEAEAAKLQILLLAAKVYVHHLNATATNGAQDRPEKNNDYETLSGEDSQEALPESSAQEARPDPTSHPVALLFNHVLLLTRYDTSYDLRDRARLYKSLLSTPSSTQLASLLLLAPKPVPSVPSPSASRKDFSLGSASLVIGAEQAGTSGLRGYEGLPDWVEEGREPDAALREEADGTRDDKTQVSAGDRLDLAGRGVPGKAIAPPVGDKTLDDWLAEESEETGEESEEEESEEEESEEEEEEEETDDDEEYDEVDEEESSEDEEEDKLVKK